MKISKETSYIRQDLVNEILKLKNMGVSMEELINAVNSIYYPNFIKNKVKTKSTKSKDLSR